MSQAVHGRDLVLSDRWHAPVGVPSRFGSFGCASQRSGPLTCRQPNAVQTKRWSGPLTCRQSAFGQLGCPAIGHAWRAPTDRQGHQPNAVQPNAVQAHQS
jgi:hypothetical protein